MVEGPFEGKEQLKRDKYELGEGFTMVKFTFTLESSRDLLSEDKIRLEHSVAESEQHKVNLNPYPLRGTAEWLILTLRAFLSE